ncbi:hypothetical protein QQX98_005525 [Neonectria punicea]|uniref:NAD-dependent epimerase/dehydratase domain-containing protein n=1 Tax=Neonectria punicea TaxID=979145 RepID=A0ABR1H4Y6_9HYPO
MRHLSTKHLESLNLALPPGSLIVVSGANGFIGSHVCDQLLAIGYLVRGTVRSLERSGWLKEYFERTYKAGNFELVEVPEIDKEGAFDEAITGAQGIIHSAPINSLDRDPDNVVPKIIATTLGIAKSAAKVPSVKRLVLTSSIAAVADPKPGVAEALTTDTYNEEVVEITDSGNIPAGLFGGHTWYIDVVDVSDLHLGALLLPEVRSERLFGSADRYTVNDFLRIFRMLYPDRGVGDDIPNVKPDLRKVPIERPAEVLKLLGVPGWTSLEDCIKPLAEQFAAASKASG